MANDHLGLQANKSASMWLLNLVKIAAISLQIQSLVVLKGKH